MGKPARPSPPRTTRIMCGVTRDTRTTSPTRATRGRRCPLLIPSPHHRGKGSLPLPRAAYAGRHRAAVSVDLPVYGVDRRGYQALRRTASHRGQVGPSRAPPTRAPPGAPRRPATRTTCPADRPDTAVFLVRTGSPSGTDAQPETSTAVTDPTHDEEER